VLLSNGFVLSAHSLSSRLHRMFFYSSLQRASIDLPTQHLLSFYCSASSPRDMKRKQGLADRPRVAEVPGRFSAGRSA
jgi:hypothetical protein